MNSEETRRSNREEKQRMKDTMCCQAYERRDEKVLPETLSFEDMSSVARHSWREIAKVSLRKNFLQLLNEGSLSSL